MSISVDSVLKLIAKNNEKLKEKLDSRISSKEGQAIKKEEDGIYVKDLSEDIKTLAENIKNQPNGVVGKTLNYGYFTMSTNQTNTIKDVKIKFDTTKYSNEITLNPDTNSITIPKGIYILSAIISIGANSASYYQFFNENENSYIGERTLVMSNSYNSTMNNGNSISTILEVNSDTTISLRCQYTSNSHIINNEFTNLTVIEISRQYTVDPLEEAQGHENEEVLFESDTPIASGDIYLKKDCREFDKLYFEYVNSSSLNGHTSSERKVDILMNTTQSNVITLTGYDNSYLNFYMFNNKTIKIVSNKEYGISRIIGKRTKNPVLMNYTANLGGFDTTVLFEGNANATGTYNFADIITNYDTILFYFAFYNQTGSSGKYTPYQKTMQYETSQLIHSNPTDIMSEHESRQINANIGINLSSMVITYIANSNANSAITRVVGIKGKNSNSVSANSKTDEEIDDFVNNLWEGGNTNE